MIQLYLYNLHKNQRHPLKYAYNDIYVRKIFLLQMKERVQDLTFNHVYFLRGRDTETGSRFFGPKALIQSKVAMWTLLKNGRFIHNPKWRPTTIMNIRAPIQFILFRVNNHLIHLYLYILTQKIAFPMFYRILDIYMSYKTKMATVSFIEISAFFSILPIFE